MPTDDDYKKNLTAEQYHVLREKGTEAPFSGDLYAEVRDGMYHCGACAVPLFSSEVKYDSGCGWPAFYNALDADTIVLTEDRRYGMFRTEVTCKNCGSHLGHVFPDRNNPSGQWFCINSVALNFKQKRS